MISLYAKRGNPHIELPGYALIGRPNMIPLNLTCQPDQVRRLVGRKGKLGYLLYVIINSKLSRQIRHDLWLTEYYWDRQAFPIIPKDAVI